MFQTASWQPPRSFDAENSLLELIARGADLGPVLDRICIGLERELVDVRCVIMVSTSDGLALELAACPTLPDDYARAILRLKVGPLAASCGAAAYRGEPVGVLDPAHAASWAGYHSLVRQHDIGAVWSFPLFGPTRVVRGTIGVHYRTPHTPTVDERATIDRAVWLAEIALEQRHATEVLRDSEARYRVASHAKDEFLAMLGHELRNPLAPIQTVLDLMKLRDGDQLLEERTMIERQVRQLGRLVDDLLDVSRVARGTVELRLAPTDLAVVVAQAIEAVAPLVGERRHTLDVSVPPDLVVDGDESRLQQVVVNLLTNASKYTPDGGRIEIVGAREGDDVILDIRDNGIGIDAAMLPKVFEMFVQEPQALDRARGGLGLGLAIVKNLVTLHHGSIEARSDGLGRGSAFSVRLPAVDATGQPLGPVVQPPQPAPRQVGRSATEVVLVVDDNPDVREMLVHLLDHLGFTTASAHDGPAALGLAVTSHPTIALLDLGLPVMDGYELARKLRAIDPAMQLIALTGYGQPRDFERTRAAGFVAHLVKPIVSDELLATIDKFLSPPTKYTA